MEDLLEVHREQLRLLGLAVADRIDAVLAQQERLLVGLVLEPLQVGAELVAAMQVHVHRVEVHGERAQILGWREARERDERAGVFLPRDVDELFDEALDLRRSRPARNVGRDLVRDRERQECRMLAALARGLAHCPAARLAIGAVFEEAAVLRPRHVHQDVEAVRLRLIQERARRRVVDAQAVGAQLAQLPEIGFDARRFRQLEAGGVRREGPVGHALHPEFRRAATQELAVDADTLAAAVRPLVVRHEWGGHPPALGRRGPSKPVDYR